LSASAGAGAGAGAAAADSSLSYESEWTPFLLKAQQLEREGSFADAEAQYESVLEIKRERSGAESVVVASACRDLGRVLALQRRFERAGGVGRQRAHRRDPQQPQPAAADLAGQRAIEQREPQRVGLAGAGRRMQQPGAAGCHLRPDLALERKGGQAARREPALGAGQRELTVAALGGAARLLRGLLLGARRA
jgi:hypothetical protein